MQCFILYFPVYVRDVKLKLKKLDGLMSTHSRADLMAVLLTLHPTKCQNNVFTSEETLVWDQTNCVHSIRNTKTEKYPFFFFFHFIQNHIWRPKFWIQNWNSAIISNGVDLQFCVFENYDVAAVRGLFYIGGDCPILFSPWQWQQQLLLAEQIKNFLWKQHFVFSSCLWSESESAFNTPHTTLLRMTWKL